jgi:hypothetical protein
MFPSSKALIYLSLYHIATFYYLLLSTWLSKALAPPNLSAVLSSRSTSRFRFSNHLPITTAEESAKTGLTTLSKNTAAKPTGLYSSTLKSAPISRDIRSGCKSQEGQKVAPSKAGSAARMSPSQTKEDLASGTLSPWRLGLGRPKYEYYFPDYGGRAGGIGRVRDFEFTYMRVRRGGGWCGKKERK